MTSRRLSKPSTRWCAALAVSLVLALAGCGPLSAQHPAASLKGVNAVALDAGDRVLTKGADVVASLAPGGHVAAVPERQSRSEDGAFHFSGAEHKARFDAEPVHHLPWFDGHCANGIAGGSDAGNWKMMGAVPHLWRISSMDACELDRKGTIAPAEKHWNEDVKGRNRLVQRARRLEFNLPNDWSGAKLVLAVAEATARKP